MRRNCHTPDESGRGLLLSELDCCADFGDPEKDLRAQRRRRRVATAVLLQHPLDRLFQAILAQAGAALIKVLPDLRAVHVAKFTVEVAVDPVEYLGTRRLMRLSAAHRPSSPGAEASEPVLANPRSDA